MTKNNIFVGCDAHEKTLVNMIAVNGDRAEQRIVANTRSGRQKLIAMLKAKAGEMGGARIAVSYEASGQGYILHDELRSEGIDCYVLAPTGIERSNKHKRNKRDKTDAERLLDMLRAHVLAGTQLPAVWVPERQTRDDRETVRMRHAVSEKLACVKTQIQTLLKRHGVEKPEGLRGSSSKPYRQWLQALAEGGEAPNAAEQGFRNALSSLLRQQEFYEAEIQRCDQAIRQLCERPHLKPIVDELDAECGVSSLGAVTYAVEIGDFSRFRRRQQVGSYWGLTPSSQESGDNNDRKGHITHQGSARIRRMLCQGTWSRVRHDAADRSRYEQLVARNPKRNKIALVAMMRRLSIRLWHVGLRAQVALKTGA
jgi:transposase